MIESIVRVQLTEDGVRRLPLDNRPDDPFVDVIKGEERTSRRPVRMAVDQDGEHVNLERHLAEIDRLQAERLGRIHPELARAFSGDAEKVRVAVWLRQPEAPGARDLQDRLRHELDEQAQRRTRREIEDDVERRATPREVVRMRESLAAVRGRGVDLVREVADAEAKPDRLAPVVYATLTREQVDRLADRDDVVGLFLYDPTGVDDLDDSIDVAGSDVVHASGVRGQGVRVAVFEQGPDATTDLDIEDQFDNTPATSSHSRHVHGIIKNVQANAPNGHAPDSLLYSANDYDALAWAVEDADCTVINQSFHRTAEATGSGLSYDDIYKDRLTLTYPWPLVVQAAGNAGESGATINPPTDEYVNHKTYNHLAVGNHSDDASSMSSTTVFRNPATSHGDRELPELAANGTSVTTVNLTLSGTSMASPAVAGAAALAQSADASLEVWPEGTRAVVLAGATETCRTTPGGMTWSRTAMPSTGQGRSMPASRS